MKSPKPNLKRVLAIDPTSRGFGFVVLESSNSLVDWGVKTLRQVKESKILAKVLALIRHYYPDVIVIEDCNGSRRGVRIQGLLDEVRRLAATEGIGSRCYQIPKVKKVFRSFHAKNKEEIAHVIAQQLPELAPSLPRHRKPWMSEGYAMAIFDAAALALTYFYSRPVRARRVVK
jgi:Holliday junction resolvasome RuvABC endonuclease subunit